MTLPLYAVEAYEALRAQVFDGGHCRDGLAALMYHGMVQGLARLKVVHSTPAPPSPTSVNPLPAVEADTALIRQLANMVLSVQSEVQHVY